MRKFRRTAFMTAICLTAVFYSACGASYEKNGDYSSSPSYIRSQSIQEAAPAMDDAGDADNGGYFDDGYPNQEEYSQIAENDFILTAEENTSTFSIDVDTASYSNVRRMLQDGYYENIPQAVRIEEMINYFSYDYPVPEDDSPFSVTTEIHECPWNPNSQLMLIGLQADKLDLSSRAPMNLVFLIDVSGSMYGEDRLGLVQKAVNMLAENLNANDRVSIVTYAGYESVLLEGAPGSDTRTITEAINNLEAGGSTAGEAGIKKAYEIAQKYFIEGGNNRVLLATDGDLNVGVSSSEELKKLVEKERDTGVNLSVLGFGYGNLKDDRLETLADNGNGNYSYIDSELEAQKVLVQEMGGTLYTVAKDVKLQLEFNDNIQSYRLIGYENRVLANEDFHNDKVDAGEIGAGHSVTALYEIVPAEDFVTNEIASLAMRYKAPDGNQSLLKEFPIAYSRTETIGKNLAFAAAVTEFGMLLRNSQYSGMASYNQIQELLSQSDIQDEYRSEFTELVDIAYGAGLLPGEATPIQPRSIPEGNPEMASAGVISEAYYQGNPVTISDEDSLIALVEMYLDPELEVDSIPDETLIQSAKESGTYIMLLLPTSTMRLIITEEDAQIIVDASQVYAMPKVIQDELNLRMRMD